MEFFKNIGLKLFNKNRPIEIEVDNGEMEVVDHTDDSHYEILDYHQISWWKLKLIKTYCLHDWYTYHTTNVNVNEDGVPQRIDHTLICRKCGKIEKISV